MNLPNVLYKYRSLSEKHRDNTKRLIVKNTIYFPTFNQFNDPFDCDLHIRIFSDESTIREKLVKLNPEASSKEIERMVQEVLNLDPEERQRNLQQGIRNETVKCGIFCLSSVPDNLLMWSHYADSHKGVCVGFKVNDDYLFGCELTKIQYQDRYPELSIANDITIDWVNNYLSTKSNDWCHEQEYRIVYRSPGEFVYPREDLNCVILGAKIEPEMKNAVIEWIRPYTGQVQVFKARLHCSEFKIVFDKVALQKE
ncbi:MAG: DUF2971 domain-containing protein [Candidatus Scalinduaceae bacterium]